MRCGLPRPLRRCRGRMEGIYVTGDFSAVVAPEQDRAPDSVSLGALCVPGATPLRATGPISPHGPAVLGAANPASPNGSPGQRDRYR